MCRLALTAYNEVRPCNLNHAILSDFLFDFGKYLAKEKEPCYSTSTIRDILRNTRSFLRSAMAEGIVPNIDVMPSVLRILDREVWPDASPDKKHSSYVIRQNLHVRDSVNAILKHLDAWKMKRELGIRQHESERDEREEALQNRCAAIYLFCLLTYGITIKEALAIKRDWEGKELPDSVYVERYGMRLNLSPTAKKLIKLYNQDSVCTEHLFYTLDNKKYNGDLDNAAKLIESHIIKYLNRNRIPLYKRKSVFIDWLNYAIECGVPDHEAEELWKQHIGIEPQPAQDMKLAAAQTQMDNAEKTLDESWYLLCLIPLSIKRNTFVDILASSGILGDKKESLKRIYAPEERVVKERGQFAVFSRYVFIRSTLAQAEYVNSHSPYAYVLRDTIENKFAKIRESEIASLQVMLRDFPDAIELVDGQKWLDEHNAKIAEGCKAVIRSGSLAGKEAKVVKVKGKKSGRPTFMIEYVEGAIKFVTSLDGVQLDLLPA